jgi:4-amino-4-deoxy-L-arabinose transferase-like glycosyltransferase
MYILGTNKVSIVRKLKANWWLLSAIIPQMPPFWKRAETWVRVTLVILATVLLSYQITRPLIDYDEAIYANVIVDTMTSGHITTPSLEGHPWFEKPPLYLWLVISLVATFGPQEWTFRLPAVIASVLCLFLTYLIVRRLTNSTFAAATSFLTLLFAPWFFFFSMEARMDSGVIASILASLLVLIKGWSEDKYLLWLFPSMAIGFLIKSVIILLVIPIAFIYSFIYKEWKWLQNRYLWLGSLIGTALVAPWLVLESYHFGSTFWRVFLIDNLARTTSTVTGTHVIM